MVAAREMAEKTSVILGASWSVDRLLSLVGAAVVSTEPSISNQLLERCAKSTDAHAAAAALLALARRQVDAPDGSAFAGVDIALRSLRSRGRQLVPPGVLEHLAAMRAYVDGDPAAAEATAERARRLLEGTGSLHEALNLQLLAVLLLPQDEQQAVALMERAATASDDPEMRAQVGHNLSLMLARVGNLRSPRHGPSVSYPRGGRGPL